MLRANRVDKKDTVRINNEFECFKMDGYGDESPLCWLFIFIVIITLLAFILIPGSLDAQAQGAHNPCTRHLKSIGAALEMYAADHDNVYPKSLMMLVPDYLEEIPACPSSKTNEGYIQSYRVSEDGLSFTLQCKGRHHKGAGFTPNRPMYNSDRGLITR